MRYFIAFAQLRSALVALGTQGATPGIPTTSVVLASNLNEKVSN